MNGLSEPATLDTNIVVYALTSSTKTPIANAALRCCAFLSVQVLNEFANVSLKKRRRSWAEIALDLADLRQAVPLLLPLDAEANSNALRIAERYRLSFYDALMLAVALSGGARTFYSEDMQHDLLIDGALRIVDPFRAGALPG